MPGRQNDSLALAATSASFSACHWSMRTGVLSSAAVLFGLRLAFASGSIDENAYRYGTLLPQAVRLFVLYALFLRQSTTFELFTYFGGVGKNGALVVVVGFVLRERVIHAVPEFWGQLLV